MAFIDRFYSKPRLDQYEAEINAAAEIRDPAARLLRYSELAKTSSAKMWSRLTNTAVFGAMLLGGVAVVAAIPFAVAATALGAAAGAVGSISMGLSLASVAASGFAMAGLTVLSQFTGRAGKLVARATQAKNDEKAAARLDTFLPSPQFDAVLAAMPSLKERFGEEAVRAARAQAAPVIVPTAPAAPGV